MTNHYGSLRLIMRYATDNVLLETTYCRECKANAPHNIGRLTCVRCGKNKGGYGQTQASRDGNNI